MDIHNFETPCFLLKENEFFANVSALGKALENNFKESIIGFSVKTNSFPYLLRLAKEAGCFAEVVSYTEYELVLLCGFAKNHIIYNGPMKSKETFLDALNNGAIVNIETKREIEWLAYLDNNKYYEVGIRLNINISEISPSDAKNENDDSRFGFSSENEELMEALSQIAKYENISLAGLHIHRTSKTRSVEFYRKLVRYAASIVHKYNLCLKYLDIGGGYYGIFRDKPTYEDYSHVISKELSVAGLSHLSIIMEPGNALTASVFDYRSSVIDTKKVGDTIFVTTDGTRNDIDPLFQKKDYIKKIDYKETKRERASLQIICGCTCLEFDRLFELEDYKTLKNGDVIEYKNVGAYTMCLSPLFIRYIPKVYSVLTGDILRLEWGAHEYINCCNF